MLGKERLAVTEYGRAMKRLLKLRVPGCDSASVSAGPGPVILSLDVGRDRNLEVSDRPDFRRRDPTG